MVYQKEENKKGEKQIEIMHRENSSETRPQVVKSTTITLHLFNLLKFYKMPHIISFLILTIIRD